MEFTRREEEEVLCKECHTVSEVGTTVICTGGQEGGVLGVGEEDSRRKNWNIRTFNMQSYTQEYWYNIRSLFMVGALKKLLYLYIHCIGIKNMRLGAMGISTITSIWYT